MYFIPNPVILTHITGIKYFGMQYIPFVGDRVCMLYQFNKRLRKYISKRIFRISAAISFLPNSEPNSVLTNNSTSFAFSEAYTTESKAINNNMRCRL